MKLSFIDKLGLFLEVAKDSYWSIIILIILLIIGYIFSSTNKKTIKRNKTIYIVFSLCILVFLLIAYSSSIDKIFDNMINNLFIVIYFPNLAVYFAAIIATSIILWFSIFNFKTSEIIKKVNLIIYIIINYLFALLLYTISDNKLNIFKQESIYGNKQATALIELTSIIFILWIIFLIIYKVILIYLRKDYKPKVKRVVVEKKIKKLPKNYMSIEVPNIVYTNKNIVKKDIIYSKEYIKQYEDMLSLEDYKLLLKLLKEKQNKNNKNNKIIKETREYIQPDLTELENLYRSIR